MSESLSENMRYNVLDLPLDDRGRPIDILDAFKELRVIDGFTQYGGEMKSNGLNRNKLISYIVLVYSHDSFLHQNHKYKFETFDRRLIIAADLVGFERQASRKNVFKNQIQERLFKLEDDEFIKMVLEYLRFQSKAEWSEWCILQHELMENNHIRLAPIKEDKDKDQIAAQEKKAKFREQSEKIREAIKNYEMKIFGDIDRLRQVQSSQKYISIEKIVKGEVVL